MDTYFTRMGDGAGIEMTGEEIRNAILEGTNDAAKRGKIPPLTGTEMDHLFDICTMPGNITGVDRGSEVVTTSDSGAFKVSLNCNITMDRTTAIQVHERVLGADSVDFGHIDYCYKAVKSVMHDEAAQLELALLNSIIPVMYGGMPNLGSYTKPDGPVESWSELLPAGKIAEARQAQEEAVEYAVKDMAYVAIGMHEAGADGMNLDTCGAAGDADFLAALMATEKIRNECPDFGVQIGMAGEFVLGMHGRLEYKGQRLAGLYPHKQVKLAEQAGATIFGAVVNTNTSRSFPWNISRVCTFMKACTEVATIPVHANVGMGVGGIPMTEMPPIDAVARSDKALVEIGKIDGL